MKSLSSAVFAFQHLGQLPGRHDVGLIAQAAEQFGKVRRQHAVAVHRQQLPHLHHRASAPRRGARKLALMMRFLLPLLLALTPSMALAIEEPGYEVVRQIGEQVEVRRYAPFVVAEMVLDTRAADAGNQAFPILAGYIFGKNKGERKLEMTAPVIQSVEPMKMAMTAPVTQNAVAGGTSVQFVLPRTVTLATAPEPLDTRVRLREEPEAVRAAIRY